MRAKLLYAIGCVLLLSRCAHDVPEPLVNNPDNGESTIDSCHPDTVYFERDILPILSSNCAFSGCHDQGSAQDEIILTSYDATKKSDIVRDFDANESEIMEVITETDSDKVMPPPPQDRLTAYQIGLIRKWIDQGAKNLTCIGSCDTTNVTFSVNIFPLIESRCKGCHSGSSPGGGIHLTNYNEIQIVATDGRLAGAVKHLKDYKAMPLGGQKLPVCQIQQIEKWIEHGAQNN